MKLCLNAWLVVFAGMAVCLVAGCAQSDVSPASRPAQAQPLWPPAFEDVSVHDPMVVESGGDFYVFGSHLAAAKSRDLMAWSLIGAGVRDDNPVIPNVTREMKEALEWGQTNTFWAGSVIRLTDGKYRYYYSVCKGDSPRSAIGLATADRVDGPYRHVAILLRSGMWGQPGEDGRIYDPTVAPNATDPQLFRDSDGNPWMVYGSYSGGIFLLRIDEQTGRPLPGQGYGRKLLGGNHSCIEAPSLLFNTSTGYYYIFLSFGGLGADGGYQIRTARARHPEGPYSDPQGHNMVDCHGPPGSFFDNAAIEPYGAKLIGNFQWQGTPTPAVTRPATIPPTGYVSPGHCSDCYAAQWGKYFILFHTRFPGCGEWHQVRVHQLLFNAKGWPVIAPHRYSGETLGRYRPDQVIGDYHFINHGRRITPAITYEQTIRLAADGKIAGAVTGSWQLTGEHNIRLTIEDEAYDGVLLRQWDPARKIPVLTFSALSDHGVAVWGNSVAAAADISAQRRTGP